jgi:iron(III) transport system ATP-binding protein
LGPSGCGKTTLLRLIAGLLEPSEGRILFDEKDVTHLPVEKRKTAMVFQGYALWPHMTVQENVEFGLKMQHVERRERRRFANDQLARVEMDGFGSRKPNQLSGGQQQRVALARALAAKSDCLLLDEPLSNLDARLRLHMREELRYLVKSSGITAIYVTHDQKEALSMADGIAVMNAGQIAQIGTPGQLYNRPATRFVADFLGEANFIDGQLFETGPPAKVKTTLGELPVDDDRTIEANSAVTCCVRPEHIAILPPDAHAQEDGSALFRAKIRSSMYLGEIRQYTCVLGKKEDVIWKVSVLADSFGEIKSGDRVSLSIAARHIALLER